MASAFDGILNEYWAIDPAWLPRLAALAQRNHNAPSVREAQPWAKVDYSALVPGATPLPSGKRAVVSNGVAVIPITGPIFPRANLLTEISGATALSILEHDLRLAIANAQVTSILLLIDSPGGAVSGIAAFADMVRQAGKRKPVQAYVAGMAASAAYWIATATGEIAMDRTGIVGSIGVVVGAAKQVAPDSDGYVTIEVVSSNAPSKRPDPTTEEGVSDIRGTLNAIEGVFISDVAAGRGITPAEVREKFGRGGVKVGRDALSAGMIDRIQTLDYTLTSLRRSVPMAARATALRARAG